MSERKFSKIVPLGARVLVKRFKPRDKTEGGILLPESAQKKVDHGKVLAVGMGEMPKGWCGDATPAHDEKKLVGKVVSFSYYSGKDVPEEVEGHDLLVILNADEVLAVLE